MAYQDERRPIHGLNTDSETRLLTPSEFKYALNFRTGSSEESNLGTGENIYGNQKIDYQLPAGTNIVRGEYEDEENQTMIYIVYNSLGNHSILRYYPDTGEVKKILQGEILNLNRTNIVHNIDLVDDLLYWNDNINPPRKINISKALADKSRKANVYFGLGEEQIWEDNTTVGYAIILKDQDGNVLVSQQAGKLTNITTYSEVAKEMSDQLNGSSGFKKYAVAQACGAFLEIEFKEVNEYTVDAQAILQGSQILAVPQNYYTDITQQTLDLIKHTPICEPLATLTSDDERKVNYLTDKTFQFAIAYTYDDNEKTTFSPVSNLVYDVIDSKKSVPGQNNAIDIDFTDDRLSNGLIKKVELFVREGNINAWRSITTLDQYQFGIGENVFRFYNDSAYSVVSDEISLKLFDAVPLLSETQEMAKSRLFFGNNLEGYDPECIDATIDVDYNDPDPGKETFTISGRINIVNPFVGGVGADKYQPIHENRNGDGKIVFGGVETTPRNFENDLGKLKQTLELEGFVVYLAGTDNYAVSKQNVNGLDTVGDRGAYAIDSNKRKNDVKIAMIGSILAPPDNTVSSTFSIENVPKGRYVLRVASHLTTDAQLNDGTRQYQKTSTTLVRAYRGATITSNPQEIEIELTGNVSDVQIDVGDMSNPVSGLNSTLAYGYIVDRDSELANDIEALNDTRITNAKLLMRNSQNQGNGVLGGMGFEWFSKEIYSDHNGFFFQASGIATTNNIRIEEVKVGDGSISVQYFKDNGDTYNNIASGNGSTDFIIRSTTKGQTDNNRTRVTGTIVANGINIKNASVILTGGDIALSKQDGTFEIVGYNNVKVSPAELIANIVVSGQDVQRTAIFPVGTTLLGVNDFNFDNTKEVGDVEITSFLKLVTNAMKRGWDGQFGIIYYDRGNRQTAVNTSDNLKIKIPFYTEKENGALNKFGTPILNWEINSTPPTWATHYQWVRTKNLAINSYLQWIVDEVKYLDENGVETTVEQAVNIEIGIVSSIANFNTKNPDSQITFSPEIGWRVRFIKNDAGEFYTEYIDEKIIQAADNVVINYGDSLKDLKKGALIEIYDPKLQIDVKTYYEIGECYRIGVLDDGTRVHTGSTQDQGASQPATGTFTTGDTYYRTRSMPLTDVGNSTLAIDDSAISDFYESTYQNIGRIQFENPDAKQLRRNTVIRFGGRYLPDTNVNNLSTFDGLDAQQLPKEYGDVNKLVLAENVLIAIQENRWVSMYIEEALLRKQSGGNEIIATTDVIGSFRALKGKTGTINPESVDEYKGYIWAYDMNKGGVYRYSINGLEDLSSKKMETYFKDTSADLIRLDKAASKNVIGKFDPHNQEYVIAFEAINAKVEGIEDIDFTQGGAGEESVVTGGFGGLGLGGGTPEPVVVETITFDTPIGLGTTGYVANQQVGNQLRAPETLSFSEDSLRWVTFYSFHPEMMSRAGIKLLTFKGGALWEFVKTALRNNFYGVQYNSQVLITSNVDPGKVKIYKALSVEANSLWYVNDMTTPAGQETEIVSQRFREKEGVFYVDIPRDKKTVGQPSEEEALNNGNVMRGHTSDILLENDSTDESVFYSATVLSIPSERS